MLFFNKMDIQDEDIYGDLPLFDVNKECDRLQEEVKVLQTRVEEFATKVDQLMIEKDNLQKQNRVLQKNISILLKTAKLEVQRKDAKINELQKELNLCKSKGQGRNNLPIITKAVPENRNKEEAVANKNVSIEAKSADRTDIRERLGKLAECSDNKADNRNSKRKISNYDDRRGNGWSDEDGRYKRKRYDDEHQRRYRDNRHDRRGYRRSPPRRSGLPSSRSRSPKDGYAKSRHRTRSKSKSPAAKSRPSREKPKEDCDRGKTQAVVRPKSPIVEQHPRISEETVKQVDSKDIKAPSCIETLPPKVVLGPTSPVDSEPYHSSVDVVDKEEGEMTDSDEYKDAEEGPIATVRRKRIRRPKRPKYKTLFTARMEQKLKRELEEEKCASTKPNLAVDETHNAKEQKVEKGGNIKEDIKAAHIETQMKNDVAEIPNGTSEHKDDDRTSKSAEKRENIESVSAETPEAILERINSRLAKRESDSMSKLSESAQNMENVGTKIGENAQAPNLKLLLPQQSQSMVVTYSPFKDSYKLIELSPIVQKSCRDLRNLSSVDSGPPPPISVFTVSKPDRPLGLTDVFGAKKESEVPDVKKTDPFDITRYRIPKKRSVDTPKENAENSSRLGEEVEKKDDSRVRSKANKERNNVKAKSSTKSIKSEVQDKGKKSEPAKAGKGGKTKAEDSPDRVKRKSVRLSTVEDKISTPAESEVLSKNEMNQLKTPLPSRSPKENEVCTDKSNLKQTSEEVDRRNSKNRIVLSDESLINSPPVTPNVALDISCVNKDVKSDQVNASQPSTLSNSKNSSIGDRGTSVETVKNSSDVEDSVLNTKIEKSSPDLPKDENQRNSENCDIANFEIFKSINATSSPSSLEKSTESHSSSRLQTDLHLSDSHNESNDSSAAASDSGASDVLDDLF